MALPLRLATHGKNHALIHFLSSDLPPARSRAAFAENKDTGKALNEFFEAEWNYEMEQSPARASSMGDRRWNDRWGDQSLEAIRKREEHATDALARLKKFDRAPAFAGRSTELRPLPEGPRDGHRGIQIPELPDADQSARRHPDSRRTRRSSPVRDREGLRRLDRAAARVSGAHGPEHRADAGRRARESDVAEDRFEPRSRADRQAARREAGRQPVLQAVQEIPGRDQRGGP